MVYDRLGKVSANSPGSRVYGAGIAGTYFVWCWAGFGLAGVDMEIGGLPLWAVTSSIGVWLFAIVLVKILLKFVFRDMPLEDGGKEGSDHE